MLPVNGTNEKPVRICEKAVVKLSAASVSTWTLRRPTFPRPVRPLPASCKTVSMSASVIAALRKRFCGVAVDNSSNGFGMPYVDKCAR